MMRATCALALLLSAAFVTARPQPAEFVRDWAVSAVQAVVDEFDGVRGIEVSLDQLLREEPRRPEHGHEHGHHGHEHGPHGFELLVKHIVRPSLAKPFVKQWLKVRDDAKDFEGSEAFTLSKPLTDNLIFYSWQKWASKKAFFEFAKNSTEAHTLAKYIEDNDIPITLTQLVSLPSGPHHGRHGPHHGPRDGPEGPRDELPLRELMDLTAADSSSSLQAWMQGGDSDVAAALRGGTSRDPHNAIVLTKFIIKPSRLFDFIKVSEYLTRSVREGEGAKVFGFSAELGNDYTVWNYAVWEGKEQVKEYLESRAARQFLEWVIDHDILTTTTILFPIEQLDE